MRNSLSFSSSYRVFGKLVEKRKIDPANVAKFIREKVNYIEPAPMHLAPGKKGGTKKTISPRQPLNGKWGEKLTSTLPGTTHGSLPLKLFLGLLRTAFWANPI